jgi:hypothetical protein
MIRRIPMRRLAPFLLMAGLFATPVVALLFIQGGMWIVGQESVDWPEPSDVVVVALNDDRTVRFKTSDGTELQASIFGLDIYEPDSTVRDLLFEVASDSLLATGNTLSCRIRKGIIFPSRMITVCDTPDGDLGELLIASGGADLCHVQMGYLPGHLDYEAVQAETREARPRLETGESEACTVRGWGTKDPA